MNSPGWSRCCHRTILNGILWRLHTGVPWRDLPERCGGWPTVYSRFHRWQRAGIWDRIFAALKAEGDARGELDWNLHHLDGTISGRTPARRGPKKLHKSSQNVCSLLAMLVKFRDNKDTIMNMSGLWYGEVLSIWRFHGLWRSPEQLLPGFVSTPLSGIRVWAPRRECPRG